MKRLGFGLLALAAAACGGDDSVVTTSAATTTASTTLASATSPPATVAATAPSVVLGIVTGRGDDQSFEAAAYFDAAPGTTRIVIGIDSDDSYGGIGDPTPDLEGWAEFGETVVVGADGEVVAGGSAEGIGDWMSWGAEGNGLRVFFIRDIAPVAGTLWVVVGDGSTPGSVAGVATGDSCSIRGSDIGAVPGGEVPDPGVTCRYP